MKSDFNGEGQCTTSKSQRRRALGRGLVLVSLILGMGRVADATLINGVVLEDTPSDHLGFFDVTLPIPAVLDSVDASLLAGYNGFWDWLVIESPSLDDPFDPNLVDLQFFVTHSVAPHAEPLIVVASFIISGVAAGAFSGSFENTVLRGGHEDIVFITGSNHLFLPLTTSIVIELHHTPEPSTALLVGTGLVAMGVGRRRRTTWPFPECRVLLLHRSRKIGSISSQR